MTRKKVKLAYISNDAARKATFKKRKKGLMKKVSELSTLCGIDACAIIYSPYEPEPDIWPSHLGVQRVISEFKKMSEMEQSRKMVNQESFLRQRISKAEEQLKKMQRDNREKEMLQVMIKNMAHEALDNLTIVDLNDLGWLVEKTSKEIEDKIKSLQTVARPQERHDEAAKNVAMDHHHIAMEAMQNQQWFNGFVKSNENHMNFAKQEAMPMPMPLPSYGYHNHTNGTAAWANFFYH